MLNLLMVYDITNIVKIFYYIGKIARFFRSNKVKLPFIIYCTRDGREETMEKKKVEKKKLDKKKLATRIMAGFLAILMLVGTVGSFIYYLINYVIKK